MIAVIGVLRIDFRPKCRKRGLGTEVSESAGEKLPSKMPKTGFGDGSP